MSGIPLYTSGMSRGEDPQPIDLGIQNLNVNAYLKGLEAGKTTPNAAGQIGAAVVQGVDAYQQAARNEQAMELQKQQLRENEMTLEAMSLITPEERAQSERLTIQERQARVESAQLKLKQEQEQRQLEEEFNSIMTKGTPEEQNQALFDGRFTLFFAKNPGAIDVAVKRGMASGAVAPDQYDAFYRDKTDTWARQLDYKQAREAQIKATQDYTTYAGDYGIKSVIADSRGAIKDPKDLLNKYDSGQILVERSDKLKIDPVTKGLTIQDGQIFKKSPDEGVSDDKATYTFYDKNGNVYASGVSSETKKRMEDARSSLVASAQTNFGGDDPGLAVAGRVRKTAGAIGRQGVNTEVVDSLADKAAAVQGQPPIQRREPTPSVAATPPVAPTPTPTPIFKKEISGFSSDQITNTHPEAVVATIKRAGGTISAITDPVVIQKTAAVMSIARDFDRAPKGSAAQVDAANSYIERRDDLAEDLISRAYQDEIVNGAKKKMFDPSTGTMKEGAASAAQLDLEAEMADHNRLVKARLAQVRDYQINNNDQTPSWYIPDAREFTLFSSLRDYYNDKNRERFRNWINQSQHETQAVLSSILAKKVATNGATLVTAALEKLRSGR